MAFNRVVVPAAGGNLGQLLAEFLGVDAEDELDLTEMQSKLYERLYRSGAVRHLDGTRATRRRASSRAADKRRRVRAKELRRARAQTRRAATRRARQGV